MKIFQTIIKLKAKSRGYSVVTNEIESQVPELKTISAGLAHLFIQHTSASLTVNENADPSVRSDFNAFFDRLVPENPSLYQHTSEGPDDMTSHIKSSLLGSSLTIPITNGRFNLGTWQGVYLCEHRNRARSRTIVVSVFGE